MKKNTKRRWVTVAALFWMAAGLSTQAFYSPNTGRWLNRDPMGEASDINLHGFVANIPVSSIDPVGLTGIVNGPTAAVFAWIAAFNASDVNPGDFLPPYTGLTGSVPGTAQEYFDFLNRVRTGTAGLADSSNPDPGSAFDSSSRNTRGWLQLPMSIDCDCTDRVKPGEAEKLERRMTSSTGFTPMPLGGFSPGSGDNSITCSSFGTGVSCNAFERSRVGPPGFNIAMTLFPMAGVPYRWSRIEYVLRCNKSYEIHYSASYFPSHRALLDGRAVATSTQSGLPAFMFAGNGVNAPGGQFHVERGTAR